ncbi:MAG: LamG domain-containing protein, partial [Steroidobacteraceae bacterium]
MNRFGLIFLAARALKAAAALALVTAVAACSSGSGGAATVVNQATTNTSSANAYAGPAASTADVTAFQINLWQNIRVQNRCGGCHHEGGQSPMFARSDDVNLAYQAVLPLINATNPSQSAMVLKVGGGHNCWVADPNACAQTLLTWINNWLGGGSASATSITLVAPPVQTVGSTKTFPTDSSGFQTYLWTPILTKYCVNCHTPTSATAQAPYFAQQDPNQAYLAAQSKIDLNTPDQSRFYQRLSQDLHHCWSTTAGGPPDCPGSAAIMLTALQAYAGSITPQVIDPALVISKALSLTQGTIAAGGARYEANIVAKYMFETGTGNIAYDTSGVSPSADLTLNSGVTWAGGWGLTFAPGGKAQASTSASQKIAQLAQGTGEYSFEAWVNPNNVTQTEAYMMTYSGSDTARNATLAQSAVSYEGRTRSSTTDTNGKPPLINAATENAAQAALQHVVLTYDPVNGQQIYVNGVLTPDKDPAGGGSLASWDSTFALALGSEVTGKEQWTGTIKFAAVHSRALTAAQVLQNFNAGVGQAYFLLFDVSSLSGIPQTYIMMKASQYDTYSYLFTNPTFISLNPSATPANINIRGIRIGVNGTIPTAGQSYATLNATVGPPSYTPAGGQVLSTVGAVIPVDQGPATDMFFLSFDQFGSFSHPYVEPTYTASAPVPGTPQPDMGIATFERVYHSMSGITGVPFTNPAVTAVYNSIQQSMPSAPQINAFLASHQTAISQMAGVYCAQLVGTQSYRDSFFAGSGLSTLDAAINANTSASSYFGTGAGNPANLGSVVTPLVNGIVGPTAYPQAALGMTTELDALLLRIPTLNGASAETVSAATIAACNAALGSA